MTKDKTQYVCSNCGAAQVRWAGKCPECGEWNTLEEVTVRAPEKARSPMAPVDSMSRPVALPAVTADEPTPPAVDDGRAEPRVGRWHRARLLRARGRRPRHRQEHAPAADGRRDRLPRGPGALRLRRGERPPNRPPRRRLGIREERLFILAEIVVEAILEQIEATKPALVIVDSIQAIYSGSSASARAR